MAAVYHRLLEEMGWRSAQRRLGIRINVDRAPSVAELEEMVRRCGLSLVPVRLRDG